MRTFKYVGQLTANAVSRPGCLLSDLRKGKPTFFILGLDF